MKRLAISFEQSLAEQRSACGDVARAVADTEGNDVAASGDASFRLEQLPPHSQAIALPPRG